MSRLTVQKTLKMYVGGKFIRSESGRTTPLTLPEGTVIHVANASRKDLRDAVGTARKAQPSWAGRTAYNRGQILYRLAEILDDRAAVLGEGAAAAADRAVHLAGWSDKITAVLSTLNPVGGTYVNYSRIRPLGVAVAAPDPADGLLGMVDAVCSIAVMGNAGIVCVPTEQAPVAIALAEALAVSDFPAGVANMLTGDVASLLAVVNILDDVDGLLLYGASAECDRAEVDAAAATVMRRVIRVPTAGTPLTPLSLQRLAEVQTVWMSAYEPAGGAATY